MENLISKITRISKDYLPAFLKDSETQNNPVWNLFMAVLFYDNEYNKSLNFSTSFNHKFYTYFGKKQQEIENFEEVLEEIIEFLKKEHCI